MRQGGEMPVLKPSLDLAHPRIDRSLEVLVSPVQTLARDRLLLPRRRMKGAGIPHVFSSSQDARLTQTRPPFTTNYNPQTGRDMRPPVTPHSSGNDRTGFSQLNVGIGLAGKTTKELDNPWGRIRQG